MNSCFPHHEEQPKHTHLTPKIKYSNTVTSKRFVLQAGLSLRACREVFLFVISTGAKRSGEIFLFSKISRQARDDRTLITPFLVISPVPIKSGTGAKRSGEVFSSLRSLSKLEMTERSLPHSLSFRLSRSSRGPERSEVERSSLHQDLSTSSRWQNAHYPIACHFDRSEVKRSEVERSSIPYVMHSKTKKPSPRGEFFKKRIETD